MYIKDVINQLRNYLPMFTDKFSEKINISSITYNAGLVTVITENNHNLQNNDVINIVGVKQKTPISSIEFSNGVAVVQTSIDHDLTMDYKFKDEQPPIEIVECSITEYNGLHNLEAVLNRLLFEFKINGTLQNASDGYLLENSYGGFSGLKQITVVNNTTFTYPVSRVLPSVGFGGYIHHSIRISGGINIERIIEGYTKQINNKYWAFVCPEDISSRKSANEINPKAYRQPLETPFSIYIFVPTADEIACRAAYDDVISLSKGIFSSLIGSKFENPYTSKYSTEVIFDTHGAFAYHNAFYIHEFRFSITDTLMPKDRVPLFSDVAFRDLSLCYNNEHEAEIMKADLKLDEV